MPSVLAVGPPESPPPHASSAIFALPDACRSNRASKSDGSDPEQSEEPGQGEQSGHVENREQLGQGDEPGQVEEPVLLERLLQVSDDDAPAHALVDSEIIRDRDQDPWVFLVEYSDF
ncbi:hypothetical protein F444_08287 [Phytophthora nicotianae P1976]|uniref:Uncharacterized protein n=1 Tax=Phytophthora nicotianae P1976 TaxID=1317066 RepID=A0A081ABM7_PHYNI|nr:hypothetical protein F444_08287 [Phytophthora nicotianae P1976]